ncbi:MAG TPA: hypothetical protein VFB79_07235 [Candidatus Angelobacter sp.]|nr:hypothetical protein [Candidatus Angelobacter sp.]
MDADKKNAVLALDQPRVIAIKDGKFVYTFHFRRITQGDWMLYFDGIHYTSRNVERAEVNELDLDTAGIELFERCLVKVEGYRGEFMSKPDWQTRVLPRHAHAASWALRSCTVSQAESDQPFDPERVEISLDAVWSITENTAQTTGYKGLLHFFAPPSAEDKRRFYRAGAQSKVVGGTRNGTTIHAKRHKVLLELYDKLILAVDGYSIGGQALSDVAEIRREMDGHHKLMAAQALFSGISNAPAVQE